MNQSQRESVGRIASACAIQELRQTRLEATFLQPPSSGEAEFVPEVEVNLQIARSPTEPKSEFATIFRFDVALNTLDEPAVALVRMQYHAILVYSLDDGVDFSDEELSLYGRTNGMIHVWPYLRGFVQNSCAQLGVPVVTLPPFRVGQSVPWLRQEQEEGNGRS